jgi:Acyl-CoA reductase (LuxC)
MPIPRRELEHILSPDGAMTAIPFLVKGELIQPPRLSADSLAAAAAMASPVAAGPRWLAVEGAQVLCTPGVPGAGPHYLVLPRLDPASVIESEPAALARELYALPLAEVLDYVGALREVLRASRTLLVEAAAATRATARQDARLLGLLFDMLPEILDPDALGQAVDRELGGPEGRGRAYLDGWVEVAESATRGVTARISDRIGAAERDPRGAVGATPLVRATPTRQLHITAGNSPLIPVLSLLRALATKGAAVIKSPIEASIVPAIIALAMRAVDPAHPITRHTSLVYWKGGDRDVEDVLFAPGVFDRLVVWGSPETVTSVARRASHARIVFFDPRYGLSLIGEEALAENCREAARLAAADSMIGNQAACTASLVHYVAGSEDHALAYCAALAAELAAWDRAMPQKLARATLGRMRLLRRGEMVAGTWFCNEVAGELSSAVVYMPAPFDLSLHPMSRLVVVRRVDRLQDVLPYMSASVSTVGIYPESARRDLRDLLAAAGVSNILPLGECERAYPGMPHDGMRVLGELVHWTSA